MEYSVAPIEDVGDMPGPAHFGAILNDMDSARLRKYLDEQVRAAEAADDELYNMDTEYLRDRLALQ